MINKQLLNPRSIVVVGGSDDTTKPGGSVLRNIIQGGFKGDLYVSNPKSDIVQGVKSFRKLEELPQTDLAIFAIAAKYCPETVEFLAAKKETRAFIILSAGFGEESEEGGLLEKRIVDAIDSVGGCLIGPNCIGVLTESYKGVFTMPIPRFESKGVELISGSGGTAVFIMESAIPNGITFSTVFSVGNSAQMGVEDVLRYMDETYDPKTSSSVKLLYIESISNPEMLLKHASSLIGKGCKIAAVKAGTTDAGSRAASSHTGALVDSDIAYDALFRKAGIIRCHGRLELASVASVLLNRPIKGKNIGVVTHAGGPAVMMTDELSKGGLYVPELKGEKSAVLLEKLYAGSSTSNPIDFLATGTAEQLGEILDACENDFDEIDGIAVIFGSPGLFPLDSVYNVLHNKIVSGKKPIYAVLPSLITAGREVTEFLDKGHVNFPDEVVFANAISKVASTYGYPLAGNSNLLVNRKAIREIIDSSENGYLDPANTQAILDASGIKRVEEGVGNTLSETMILAEKVGFPLVMKVVGPVHKSDVGGVVLNVDSLSRVEQEFDRLMGINQATGVMIQPMASGTELFIGAKLEGEFGHLVLCGLGGIYIEVLKDIAAGLAPLSQEEAKGMVESLRGYKLLEGVRGQEGVNIEMFIDTIIRLSQLVSVAPEIFEMDLNPLLGSKKGVIAVDARVRIEKSRG